MAGEAEQVLDHPVEVTVPPDTAPVVDVETPKIDATGRAHDPKTGEFVEKPNDDAALLRAQLEATKRAADQAQRAAYQQAERAAKAEQQARAHQQTGEQAQYDAILNAIGSAKAEAEAAERDFEAAVASQDARAMADAQRRIARAEARGVQLEDGKMAYEAQAERNRILAERQAAYVQQQQQRQQPTVDQYIDNLRDVSPQERAWLKSHPETMTDRDKNVALQFHAGEASKRGFQRNTQEFFDYVEKAMGYQQERTEQRQEPERRTPSYAAPPSRDAPSPSGAVSSTRVTLTPQQQEAARIAGISNVEYAKQVIRLKNEQRAGNYSEAR